MKERRSISDRDFEGKWSNLASIVGRENIYIHSSDMIFEVIRDFEKDPTIKKKYIIQFLVIPVIYNGKKGVITFDPFARVPLFLMKEYSSFIILADKKYCSNLALNSFSSSNKLEISKGESPLNFIIKMITKMEQLRASDLTLSWTSSNVILKYTVSNKNLYEENDYIDVEFSEKIRVALVNLSHERPSEGFIDGKLNIQILGKKKEYRLSVVQTVVGYSIVLRSYQKFNKEMKISDLGYTQKAYSILEEIIYQNSHGLFLICGPTGSGKTTTIYTILQELYMKKDLKIKTAEDPVEIQIDGIDQCNINTHGSEEYKITYQKILSKYMRQKPDAIMIGEIRDKTVAKACVEASLTGHLTVSTLHTSNVESTFSRLINSLDISYDQIEDSLIGILNQKLVKKLCDCKIKKGDGYIANPNGCDKCKRTGNIGYDGEVLASEIVKLKIGIESYKSENYEKFYTFSECADDLYNSGTIDKTTKTYIENL